MLQLKYIYLKNRKQSIDKQHECHIMVNKKKVHIFYKKSA